MPTSWLDAICNPEARNRPSFVTSPRTARVNGAAYSVASDSVRIIFLPGDLGYDMTDQTDDNLLADHFEPDNPIATWDEQVARLRGWVVEPVACEYQKDHGKGAVCLACHGTCKTACACDTCGHTHEAPCDACEGIGRGERVVCLECSFDPKLGVQTERLGWLADNVLVNRHLFNDVLPHVPDTTLTIMVGNQFDPIFLVGASGIRVVVMPSRHEGHAKVDSRLADYQAKPVRRGHLLASA